ncbi:MAG: hypothetical protein P4L33_19905 [Capsulimonadaceae bacterium]|nr:hypothetical protein [Capsulimonadaceae bacterium]
MKALLAILGVLVVLGVTYALAFFGVIPVARMAAHNAGAAKVFVALKLYHAPKSKAAMSNALAPLVPAPDPLAADRQALDAERIQLAQQKAALDKKAAGGDTTGGPVTTSSKMSAIYDTMKPAEIAGIFEKLPDDQVCDALIHMDEQKAGKVLVALPQNRAAKLTIMMNRATANGPQTGQQAPSSVATSVP